MNRKMYVGMLSQIKSGRSEALGYSTNSRSIHIVNVRDMNVVVVYSKSQERILTALPSDYKF